MIDHPSERYRYSVQYRRLDAPTSRVFHRTVTARDADEARLLVKIADPLFYATAKTPRRGARAAQEKGEAG